jgi:GalNAc5-diNAcBac-PP-undecaprenol beta-1,3-glucosyltransferase
MRATVLVPTHDHGPTLTRSVGSALAQTVTDLEVFVVGDGVSDETRGLVADLADGDDRVRFFDNPKGPRHGELHRHAALAEARGEIVCYLSDDDLWLPEHVASMLELLAAHDFANALPVRVEPDGSLGAWIVDLSLERYRELLLGGENRIPLSCASHTLELYRRLPHGWRTTPSGIPTDLYMFQQILAVPGVRAVSGRTATVLHFPSSARPDAGLDERLAELDRYAGVEPTDGLCNGLVQAAVWADAERLRLAEHVRSLEAELGSVAEHLRNVESAVEQLRGDYEALGRTYEAAERERVQLQQLASEQDARLRDLAGSVTWRLRARLVALPVVGSALRRVARALAGRAGR